MNSLKEKVGDVEIILIILGIKLGERFASLPRVAVENAGYAGVPSILFGGLVALVIAYFFAKLSLNFPDKTIIEYSQIILGKVLGKLVIAIFFIYFFAFGAIFVRRIPEFIKQMFLYSTPVEVIIIIFIFVTGYCAAQSLSIYARVSNVLMGLGTMATIFLIFASISFVKYQELLPIFQFESLKRTNIINLGVTSYCGIEVIPFLIAFMKRPKNIKRNSSIALMIALVIYTLDVVISIGVLGESALLYQNYPVFDVAKTIVFPTFFDIRADIMFASLWILLIYVVMAGYHYLSSTTLSSVIGLKNHSVFAVLLIPLFYMFSLLPQNLGEMNLAVEFLGRVWLYGIVGIIFFIYLVGIIRKKVKI